MITVKTSSLSISGVIVITVIFYIFVVAYVVQLTIYRVLCSRFVVVGGGGGVYCVAASRQPSPRAVKR